MHNEYFQLQWDHHILQDFSSDKVLTTKKNAKIFIIQIERNFCQTSSCRFCRRLERSSIFRSKRSTRIAFAPFNFVADIFESATCAPRVSLPFSSILNHQSNSFRED